MPRKRSDNPPLKFHVSGQGRVDLGGKTFYCGPYGTIECHRRYHALVTAYLENGFQAPEDVETHQKEKPITISMLVDDFKEEGLPKIGDEAHRSKFETVCSELDDLYGHLDIARFGPRLFVEFRKHLSSEDRCRDYINTLARYTIRVFKHGVTRELLKGTQLYELNQVEPLKFGEAKENPPREAVPLKAVQEALPHLDPVVADMVKIQLATGCRPSELFSLVPGEVDRSSDAWMIRKRRHKTKRHGKSKSIPIVGDTRAVLAKYLDGDADEPCFTNRRGTAWNKDTYRRHITRACEANELQHWTPYQIRHLVGQSVRDSLTAEHVQAILGHSKVSMAETYSQVAEAKAIEAAKAIQK